MDILEALGKIGFDWKMAIANLFNFIIVILLIKKLLFPGIQKYIEERNRKINEGLDNAKKMEEGLQKLDEEYKTKLSEARKEANEIIEKANVFAEEKKEQVIEKTKEEIKKLNDREKANIELQKNQTIKEVKKNISGLIIESLEKVLDKKMDKDELSKTIKEISKE